MDHPNFMRIWPEESADGKFVYYRGWGEIFRVPSEGGAEEEFAQLDMSWAGVQFTPKGLYFSEWRRALRKQVISFYDFASRQTALVFRGSDTSGFAISPDGMTILYPRVDRSDTNLMLVEGFK